MREHNVLASFCIVSRRHSLPPISASSGSALSGCLTEVPGLHCEGGVTSPNWQPDACLSKKSIELYDKVAVPGPTATRRFGK